MTTYIVSWFDYQCEEIVEGSFESLPDAADWARAKIAEYKYSNPSVSILVPESEWQAALPPHPST